MSMEVKFHSLATKEIERSFRWYKKRSPRAAVRFLVAIDEAIERIVKDPSGIPMTSNDCHRCALKRFPFSLIYKQLSVKELVVVAVAHDRRRPSYWGNRVP